MTGQPVWPIEERPVPKGDVPGEWYSPTQPFPTKPPAYERQGVSIDDLIDFTPELRAEAVELVKRYTMGPLFTPPVVSKLEGPLGALTLTSQAARTGRAGRTIPRRICVYVFVDRRNRLAWDSCLRPPDSRRCATSPATPLRRPADRRQGSAAGGGKAFSPRQPVGRDGSAAGGRCGTGSRRCRRGPTAAAAVKAAAAEG